MTEEIFGIGSTRVRATPSDLIHYALDNKADIEQLERLYALQQKWDSDEAKRTFVAAMAHAKVRAPEIPKDKHVEFQTKSGATAYFQATVDNAVTIVVPWLARHGFSHHWSMRHEGGLIYVTCVLRHLAGHSEACEMFAAVDESGGKNSIRAIVSTKTCLERHTLLAVAGLATSEHDDDARAAGGAGVSGEETTIRSL